MNNNLKEALDILEKEKSIDKKVMLDAIKTSLENVYRNYFIKKYKMTKNKITIDLKVVVDEDTYDYSIFLGKEVIPDDLDIISELTEVHYKDAKKADENAEIGDIVYIEISNIDFGHIATQNAKGIIIQKLREEEKNSLYLEFKRKEHTVVSGTVARRFKNSITINLGKADGILLESEQLKNEILKIGDIIKVYIQEVINTPKGTKIKVSRTDTNFIKKLFEQEVNEIKDGAVEIKSIAREPGSRTKMAVYSSHANIDAIGACLGVNSIRVNAVVEELHNEKIDIINWDEDISTFIENALSPAKTVLIVADEDTKSALVIVPDSQLSLAIGKEGQNARLAAKLTNYKIDIKSETQAIENGIFDELGLEYDHSLYKNIDSNKKNNNDLVNADN